MSVETILEYIPFIPSISELQDGGMTWRIAFGMFNDAIFIAIVGWLFAWLWERRHLKALDKREDELAHISVESGPKAIADNSLTSSGDILSGSIVLSHDMFRGFTILITRVFGGNIKQYERLLLRARREAILRLKEDAIGQGFERVINLKIVTTSIKRSGPRSVEVLAYGTGVFS